jgi:polysaccharide pyruvyl transferase WcaK-like protein
MHRAGEPAAGTERMQPTVCLLGASFGTSNMGVNALAAGTIKAFSVSYPSGALFLFDYGKAGSTTNVRLGDGTVPVQLVNIRFSKKFYLGNNIALLLALALFARCLPVRRLRRKVVSGNYSLRRMSEADTVVSLAGGDSFSDIYGLGRLLYVALPQLLALFLGKRLVLLPQTIGPFNGVVARALARRIMRRAALIYSRDRRGLEETKTLTGAGTNAEKVRFCYDVGFVVDPVKPAVLDLEGLQEQLHRAAPVVGLNVSGLLWMGGYRQNNMFGLLVDYRQLVFDLIDRLVSLRGATVLLVPHVFGSREHAESDSTACESAGAELKLRHRGRVYMARGEYDQGEIKYVIGLCDMFVGSRMHACIAALSQNIPTVSIAYSRKFVGVMESIGVADLVADPRKLGSEAIMGVVDRVYDQRAAIRRQLEQTMPQVKETVLRLFPEIVGTA